MDEVSGRIIQVREALRLSQKRFGRNIGMNRDTINNLEHDKVRIKDFHKKCICLYYGVNEDWLNTGEGEMFSDEKAALLERLQAVYSLSDSDARMIARFAEMPKEKRKCIHSFIEIAGELD